MNELINWRKLLFFATIKKNILWYDLLIIITIKFMKVILLQDVAKIGKRYEVVNLPDGYALNQLIPKKMAEPATPSNLKKIELRKTKIDASKQSDTEKFEAVKSILSETKITVAFDANEQGHLFKAVHEADIVKAAQEQSIDLPLSMVKIVNHIKSLGEHQFNLVHDTKSVPLVIEVVKK